MVLKVRPLLLCVGSGITSTVPFAVQILTLIPQKPVLGVVSELLLVGRAVIRTTNSLVRPTFSFCSSCLSGADGGHPSAVLVSKLDIIDKAFFLTGRSTIDGEWSVHGEQPPSVTIASNGKLLTNCLQLNGFV